MDFLKTQLGKLLEEVKRSYASGFPVVYIPTSQKELINDLLFSPSCWNQIIPGIHIKDNEEGKGINIKHYYTPQICHSIGFENIDRVNNYYVQYSNIGYESNKTENPIPYVFVLFGSFDKIGDEKEQTLDLCKVVNNYLLDRMLTIKGKDIVPFKKKESASKSLLIVVTSEQETVPSEFADYVKIVKVPPMSDEEISEIIKSHCVANQIAIEQRESQIHNMVVLLRGFSKFKIKTLLNRLLVDDIIHDFKSDEIKRIILQSKKELLSSSHGLNWENSEGQDAIGLNIAKEWLASKKKLFVDVDESIAEGYDIPNGILMSGIPGSGKSLMAKETARTLDLPLISFDMGGVLGSYVGESEHNMINALRMAESMSPCVLWIDEIEKAFSGSNSSSGDNGVSQRLFGKFLTWLQEKKSACFVFATSNDVTSLPPELFRSERFDRKFYTFLPTVEECAKIIVAYITGANNNYEKKIKKPGEPEIMFDPGLKSESIWVDLLDRVCASSDEYEHIMLTNNEESDKTVHKKETWLWKEGTKPRVKIFSGADLSAIIKEAKFIVLNNKNQESYCEYIFPKDDFVNAVQSVIRDNVINQYSDRDFKPYGETNQKDIAKCYIKLSENQFHPSSDAGLISLARYDRNEGRYVLPQDWSIGSIKHRYDQVLFCLIVGAVNQYAKEIIEESNRR